MKNLLYILVIMLFVSCKKDQFSYQSKFQSSQAKWTSYKKTINNSYSYVAGFVSIFGAYDATTITVMNGTVTGRSYTAGFYPQNSTVATVTKTWTEDSTTLNTHQEGAVPLTLDEIYAKAPTEWLSADKTKNKVYFETDSNGLIASCGYVPNGCQDDCFLGINISSVTAL
jgi:hypothetical protein